MSIATAATPGDDGVAPSAALEGIPTNGTEKRKRSGGPRTARGKEISAKNSTRHGILSTSPVIDLESEEDWEAHLEGMRASLKPVGHHEEVLVHRAAFCLWRRARVDEWATMIVDAQLALVDLKPAVEGDPSEKRMLDGQWGIVDPELALAALDALRGQPDTFPLSTEGARGIIAVLQNTGKAHRNTRWVGIPERVDPEMFEGWTAGQMRRSLEVIAEDCQSSYDTVWEVVRWNLWAIVQFKEVHDIYRQNSRALRSYQAMMPSGADAELEIRYAAHFDRDLARNLKWLEEAQRARNNDLPAPIRIDIG